MGFFSHSFANAVVMRETAIKNDSHSLRTVKCHHGEGWHGDADPLEPCSACGQFKCSSLWDSPGAGAPALEAQMSGVVWNMQPLSAPGNYASGSSSSSLSNLYRKCSVAFINVRI